jgi:hypothetical protein
MKSFKNFLLTGIIIQSLMISGLYAQNYKKTKFSFQYITPPKIVLSENIRTFAVKINPGDIDFKYIRHDEMLAWIQINQNSNYGSVKVAEREFLQLQGFSRDSINPDLIIEARLTPMKILSKKIIRHEMCQAVGAPCYAYQIGYQFGSHLTVRTKDNELLTDSIFADSNKTYYAWFGVGTAKEGINKWFYEPNGQTFAYRSPDELESKFQNSLPSIYAQVTKEYLLMEEKLINDLFGYVPTNKQFIYASEKSDKKHNYTDLEEAINLISESIEAFNQKADTGFWKPQFRKSISIWEQALLEYNGNNKNARIYPNLASGLCSNIAITAIWLRDWTKVEEYTEKAKQISPALSNSSAAILEISKDLQNRFAEK